MKLSLLDFNTFGTPFFSPNITVRYQHIAQTINEEAPDIVCLQEVQSYYHLFLLKKYLTAYPHLIYKKYTYGPKGGLVIASKVPFEDVKYKSFTELGSFRNISFYTRLLQNGMLICKLKDVPVTIINTHLVSDFEFDWSTQNKLYETVQAQVEQTTHEVNRIAKKGHSVIITGDFNMKKKAKLYDFFLDQTKAKDAFAQATEPTYYKDRLKYRFNGKSSERIDFIFMKDLAKHLKIQKTSQLFEHQVTLSKDKRSYLSDHIGLKVDFDTV